MSILDRVPDYIRSLIPYEPGKPIEEVEREYGIEDPIKIASNENPLGPSPKALKAIAERLNALHLYPDGDCYQLRRAVAAHLGVAEDRLIFGNGSNELIEFAVRTFMRPGDEAVMARHAFAIYHLVVKVAGGVSKIVPMKNLTHDLEAMGEATTPNTRIVFLANPNNPTGTSFKKKAWEKFLGRVGPETLIVVDEAYFEYVTDPEYPNSIEYQNDGRMILTFRTFSKLYGLAGLRLGYAVGSKEVVGLMHRVRQPFNVNSIAQWGAIAALEDIEHVRRSLETNRAGMDYLTGEVAKLGLEHVPSQANFILLRVGNGAAVFQKLLERGVIVRPMGGYELPEYIRVTIGTAKENARFINELKGIIATRA
jgi:histidinol-phosphate aminotransferase